MRSHHDIYDIYPALHLPEVRSIYPSLHLPEVRSIYPALHLPEVRSIYLPCPTLTRSKEHLPCPTLTRSKEHLPPQPWQSPYSQSIIKKYKKNLFRLNVFFYHSLTNASYYNLQLKKILFDFRSKD